MKNRSISKKFLATLLAVIMLVGTLYVPASAKGFSDISSSHASLDAINYVSDNAIMAGTSSTTFSPNTEVTRGMVVTVLYQKAGAPAVSGTNKFTDVSSSAYYYKAVLWASTNGIAGGTSSTTFSPNNKITRQDAALMLYNLGKKMGYDVSKTTSITGCFDYSTVSTYARTAMAWGVATDVVPADSGYLYPTHTVTRAQLAEFVTTFGTNVEKIVCGKDNLGLTNEWDNFTLLPNPRYLTKAHLDKLHSVVRANVSSSRVQTIFDLIEDRRTKEGWTGACYGISVVTMLDKMGKIAFNENYRASAKRMSNVTSVKGEKAESAINFYQLSYAIPGSGGVGNSGSISTDVTNATNTMMNSNTPVILSYFWKDGTDTHGHSVIVNSCKKSGTSYILSICNPNNLSPETITLTAGGKITHGNETVQLEYIKVRSEYSFYDMMDIDSYTNIDNTQNLSAPSGKIPYSKTYATDYSTIEVKLNGDFVIRNDNGEYLQFDSDGLTGNMEVYDIRLEATNENSAAYMFIDVPTSKNFAVDCLTEGADIWFAVADPYRYSRISGTDMTAISIDENGKMDIDGAAPKFEVAYGAPQEKSPLLNLSGTGFGFVTTEVNGDRMQASGNIKDYIIKSFDFEGNLMYDKITSNLQVEKATDILQDSSAESE